MKIEFIELALLETLEQIFGENPIWIFRVFPNKI
jgi:hypothetical protein